MPSAGQSCGGQRESMMAGACEEKEGIRTVVVKLLHNSKHNDPIESIKQTEDSRQTSVGVSEYSLVLSTDTMLVSSSLVMQTIQFNICVTCKAKEGRERKGGTGREGERGREGGGSEGRGDIFTRRG